MRAPECKRFILSPRKVSAGPRAACRETIRGARVAQGIQGVKSGEQRNFIEIALCFALLWSKLGKYHWNRCIMCYPGHEITWRQQLAVEHGMWTAAALAGEG